MAEFQNHPLKVTLEKGWLRKKMQDVVVTNYSYGMGENDGQTIVDIYDGKFNVIAKYPVALSMRQFFNAQNDSMESGEVIDLSPSGVAALQEKYARQADSLLCEGHIKSHFRLQKF